MLKTDFEKTPNLGRQAKEVWPADHTMARLGPSFVPRRLLVSYCL
jgi:hypothetical protein